MGGWRNVVAIGSIELVLAGCDEGEQAPTPLADGEVTASILAHLEPRYDPPQIILSLKWSNGQCPTITEATVTLDGVAMSGGHGGPYSLDGETLCSPITFVATEVVANATTFVIEDSSASWTIEVDDLLAVDIAMSGVPTTGGHVLVDWPTAVIAGQPEWNPHATFVGEAGQGITGAAVSSTRMGSMFDLKIKLLGFDEIPGPTPGTLTIMGTRHPVSRPPRPSFGIARCEGPLACTAEIHVAADTP